VLIRLPKNPAIKENPIAVPKLMVRSFPTINIANVQTTKKGSHQIIK